MAKGGLSHQTIITFFVLAAMVTGIVLIVLSINRTDDEARDPLWYSMLSASGLLLASIAIFVVVGYAKGLKHNMYWSTITLSVFVAIASLILIVVIFINKEFESDQERKDWQLMYGGYIFLYVPTVVSLAILSTAQSYAFS